MDWYSRSAWSLRYDRWPEYILGYVMTNGMLCCGSDTILRSGRKEPGLPILSLVPATQ